MAKIAIAADHGGYELKETFKKRYPDLIDLGTDSEASVDYPDFAAKMAEYLLSGKAETGILICGTGIGISIAANRYHGIRAAILYNDETARLAHEHNNANIAVFGGREMSVEDCLRRFDIFLKAKYEGGRHEHRLEKIERGC